MVTPFSKSSVNTVLGDINAFKLSVPISTICTSGAGKGCYSLVKAVIVCWQNSALHHLTGAEPAFISIIKF